MNKRRWVLGVIVGTLVLMVSCGVCVGLVVDEGIGGIETSGCHYDATANMSLITEGKMDAQGNMVSSSRTERGNVCN